MACAVVWLCKRKCKTCSNTVGKFQKIYVCSIILSCLRSAKSARFLHRFDRIASSLSMCVCVSAAHSCPSVPLLFPTQTSSGHRSVRSCSRSQIRIFVGKAPVKRNSILRQISFPPLLVRRFTVPLHLTSLDAVGIPATALEASPHPLMCMCSQVDPKKIEEVALKRFLQVW